MMIINGMETIPPTVFLKRELPFRRRKSEKGKRLTLCSNCDAISII